MTTLRLDSVKHVFLLGATGGIGSAILTYLLEQNSSLKVYALTRAPVEHPRVVNEVVAEINETTISDFLLKTGDSKFDLVLNAIGYLENELGGPEKSLRDITEAKLLAAFRVNAILTPLLAKAIREKLSPDGFAFVTLSAMVGSIGENELGGWYGYRASKAALNALIKNIAIEWHRSHKQSLVLAIHPGTTHTKLSEKFSTRVTHTIHAPAAAAENICRVIFSTPYEKTGQFLNWDGRVIEW